jgi:hypothetical protein
MHACVKDLLTKTKKQPSPDVNPANHSPACTGIAIFSTIGLCCIQRCIQRCIQHAGIIPGKAIFKLSDKPKFKEALKLRIVKSPS